MMGENVAITDFMILGDDYNGFTTSEIAQMVYFPRDGDKRSAARDERIRRNRNHP